MRYFFIVLRTLVVFTSVFFLSNTYAENPRIKIGVIVPLSGGNATTGIAIKNGIELARHDHQEILRDLIFVYEDDGFDPKRDITAFNRLMVGQRPDVIFGLGPNLVEVLAARLEGEQLPLVNFGFVAAPTIGKPLVVRTMNHTDQYMQALANYLKSEGLKELPVVVGEHAFFRAMTNSLVKGFGADQMVREIANPAPDEVDFRGVILKLRNFRNTRVGLMLFAPSLIAFLKQARGSGLTESFFGTDVCEGAATLSEDPSLLDGCIYPDNDASETFRAKYRKMFGDEAHLAFAANAYDMALLVGEVFQRSDKVKAGEFMLALMHVKDRKGELGTFSYTETNDGGKFFEYPIHVKRIKSRRGVAIR